MLKVIAPSFLKNPQLVNELRSLFPDAALYTGAEWDTEALRLFCADAEALIVGREKIDEAFLQNCPALRIVAKYGVGIDNIDQQALQKYKVQLGWTGGVNKRSVAELTIGFLLGAAHNTFFTGNRLKKDIWYKDGGVCVQERRLGIIGLGHIGTEVAELLQPFSMEIWANDILDKTTEATRLNIRLCEKEEIYRNCDFISLHVPYTPETYRMINDRVLEQMLPHAFVLNCARGELVDHEAMIRALEQERIGGYFADAFDPEPYTDSRLTGLDNFFGTPHIGGNSREAVLNMGRSAIEHIRRFYV